MITLILLLLCAPSVWAQADRSGSEEARALVKRVETQYQGETSHAIARMRVVTAKWTREMTLEMWSKGRDRFLVRPSCPNPSTNLVSSERWKFHGFILEEGVDR
jgi:hypothetical protein